MSAPTRRVAAVAASLALISLGVFIRGQLPKAEDLVYAPHEYGSTAPKLGTFDSARVTVSEKLNGVPSHAGWVQVNFGFTPEATTVLRGRIQAEDGTLFDSVGPGLRACEVIYPGVRTECTMVFEMPLDKLPGATLLLDPMTTQMAPRASLLLDDPSVTGEITVEGIDL